MLRIAVVGVGKMGLSHLSILGAHPDVTIAAMCDTSGYVLDVLEKYTGMHAAGDYQKMLDAVPLDAVVIATPTKAHYPMVRAALERGLHVFCEKPLTLSSEESRALVELAAEKGLVAQVGYHNRFVGAFAETRRLLDLGAIGRVTHATAEAYGPVVLKAKGATWRSQRSEGGGCLYDYAAHPLDLLTWYLGTPERVGGTHLGKIFSTATEDEVYSTLFYDDGSTAQLSVNWSDESYRKMSTRITLSGTHGRITVDRQECQVYLRDTQPAPAGYQHGWNVKYTTELTAPVWFYLRGEEYSAELDYFVRSASGALGSDEPAAQNSFETAAVTDRVIELLIRDAEQPGSGTGDAPGHTARRPSPADARRQRLAAVSARARVLLGDTVASGRARIARARSTRKAVR
ncbi:Gfo/Idh/MocA family oxidoreductase [Nocardioides sp. 1609]|uniref:Gfo/Idh/MocA family protein n=1 Tax=Nocardioides sp. 1609 TaxID=2508327 RepID=UPI00106FE3AF|nr:Gfo/Idh/MocA family oxidoreductase [Nocardioides sp. 1609]